jgi:hypothetical protein
MRVLIFRREMRRDQLKISNFQEGRDENYDFQVGKEEEMRLCESLRNLERSSYQQGVLTQMEETRLSKSLMNSGESSYHQGVLTEEDHKCILMIGGIGIFLPSSPTEANAASIRERGHGAKCFKI